MCDRASLALIAIDIVWDITGAAPGGLEDDDALTITPDAVDSTVAIVHFDPESRQSATITKAAARGLGVNTKQIAVFASRGSWLSVLVADDFDAHVEKHIA